MQRELSRLAQQHNADGRRGLSGGRDPDRDPQQPERLFRLFHSPVASSECNGGRRLQLLHANPNVYLVEHFVSARELEHLDALITQRRKLFRHSHTDDAAGGGQVVSQERTSLSLHLQKASDSTLRNIEARAAELVGLPPDHVEPLQVVSYTNGQYFDLHHDLGPIVSLCDSDGDADGVGGEEEGDVDGIDRSRVGGTRASRHGAGSRSGRGCCEIVVAAPPGPRRLVTLFVYLNTLPKGVGHTEFPQLRLSVQPRCGSALLFCNVLPNGEPDGRLSHRACPVPEGHFKFGANIWITDVSMQAHVTLAGRPRAKPKATGGGGILKPLLLADVDELNVPAASAIIGLEIRKLFRAHGFFDGKVVSHHAATGYRVLYEDGDEEDMSLEDLLKLPLTAPQSLVGRSVSKHFPGSGRFEGTVKDFSKQGFLVEYEDGDAEHLSSRQLVRILAPVKPAKKKRKRPPPASIP